MSSLVTFAAVLHPQQEALYRHCYQYRLMFSLFILFFKTLGLWTMFYLEQYKNWPMSVVPTLHRPVGWDLGKLMLKDYTSMSWRQRDEVGSLQRRWSFFSCICSYLFLSLTYGCVQAQDEAELRTFDFDFFSTKTSYRSLLHCDTEGMAMQFWKSINSLKKFLCRIVTVFINNHKTELSEWRKPFSFTLMGECEPKYLESLQIHWQQVSLTSHVVLHCSEHAVLGLVLINQV